MTDVGAEKPYKPIVWKSEDSMWRLLADGSKTWEGRRWDLSDERVYRLIAFRYADTPAVHYLAESTVQAISREAQKDMGVIPDEPYVSFLNKATGEYVTFEYKGVEFAPWAPGWGFILLGEKVVLDAKFFEEEVL